MIHIVVFWNQQSHSRRPLSRRFDYILSNIVTHHHLVCELHPYLKFIWDLRTWLRIIHFLIFISHLYRFYHTLGHYPGHQLCFHIDLVDRALGSPRNLTMLLRNTLATCKSFLTAFCPLYKPPLWYLFTNYSDVKGRDVINMCWWHMLTRSSSFKIHNCKDLSQALCTLKRLPILSRVRLTYCMHKCSTRAAQDI